MSIVSTIGPNGNRVEAEAEVSGIDRFLESIEAFRRRSLALKALSNDEVEQLVAVAKQSVEAATVAMNDELLMVGNDFSDVLLDAACEIEALRAQVETWQQAFSNTHIESISALLKASVNLDAKDAKLADCQAEAEGLRADAERYRWLRDNNTDAWERAGVVGFYDWILTSEGESLNQVIDKAREA